MIRFLAIVFIGFSFSPTAAAACWKLKDGTYVSASKSPASKARRTRSSYCSSSKPSAQSRPVTESSTSPAVSAKPVVSRVDPVVTKVIKSSDSRECVEYARFKAPGLPTGLFTIGDKKAIVNASRAAVGYVAVIEVPSGGSAEYGHVAYVEAVTKDSITISETNFGGKHLQFRTAVAANLADAEKELRIVGYWAPN